MIALGKEGLMEPIVGAEEVTRTSSFKDFSFWYF
jgi:hypothetical protein